MDPADKDVLGDLLNKDRTFGMIYKVNPLQVAAHCIFLLAEQD